MAKILKLEMVPPQKWETKTRIVLFITCVIYSQLALRQQRTTYKWDPRRLASEGWPS